jgi:hypothetical protein
MQTVTIEINNTHAARLIDELAAMNLIRVIKKMPAKENKKKLSERLAGSITSKQGKQMHKELAQMRNEWERDT